MKPLVKGLWVHQLSSRRKGREHSRALTIMGTTGSTMSTEERFYAENRAKVFDNLVFISGRIREI